ncbi:efflux transporter outer membrane subunit [Mitsuaria sp. GD03876]|uniref:efflux transporter outer membrane subunit n=1 Tax=Mitsuaria sp. GD03876 TaxID=2975399 RepID=UPI0024490B3F|nr:efflux transporter outer membrane subunit [Mitsuaria sp. GD03876]MDH0863226.1 efflux transporter outer membrane subunit [Mitsuaria sp. GD03876]
MLLLAGCTTVGPDYAGAPAIAADALQQARFARDDARDKPASPVAAHWWRALNDPALDALVDEALGQSPTLQAAEARLRAARATFQQQEASGRPKGSASALAAGVWQGPGTDHDTSLHLYSVGFDATWEVDLFGGTRRAVESASAQAEAVRADLADAQVSLTAEVASTYVGLRAQQRRQALLRDTADGDAQALALVRQRLDQGVATADDVEQRTQQREATHAALADVAAQIAASLDRLALLTGQAPGALDARLAAATPSLPSAPAEVAIGDPASLLQRRPDIRAAERRLASHTAQIGQETAKYFPKLSLLGNVGVAATSPGQLFRTDNLALAAVPYLSWNFLDFGRTAALVKQAEAGRDEAVANYKAAVLTALQDANTSLARFGRQRQALQHLLAQQGSAQRALDLTRQRRQAGVTTEVDLLDARRHDIDARLKSLDGEADLLKDFVALQKSLGLGWDLPA